MPFVSQAQRRACWAKYNKDIKEGRTPAWDCKEWEKYTAKMNGPLLELLEEKKKLETNVSRNNKDADDLCWLKILNKNIDQL